MENKFKISQRVKLKPFMDSDLKGIIAETPAYNAKHFDSLCIYTVLWNGESTPRVCHQENMECDNGLYIEDHIMFLMAV